MGRQRRPYQPGGIVHLTARTLRHERWFSPRLRTAVMKTIADVVPRSRMRLLAVAVMSNHFHIVAQQGKQPLEDLMQPLLRRLAHLVQQARGIDGPIFWRPYGSEPCQDPTHARNGIAYSHLNPVRAGICDNPADYRWTSHGLYLRARDREWSQELELLEPVLDPDVALPLFAVGTGRSTVELRDDYRAFIDWRMKADAALEDDDVPVDLEPPAHPSWPWHGAPWGASLSPLFHPPMRGDRAADGVRPPRPGPELARVAQVALEAEAPDVSMDSIRGRGGGRWASRLRHIVIRRLHAAGFPNVAIARFLDLSESAVSYVIRKPRRSS